MRTRFALSSAICLSLLATSSMAYAFSDVRVSSSVGAAVGILQSQGILNGYADGTYRPTSYVNRAEFLKVLLAAVPDAGMNADTKCFNDFYGSEQWYWRSACEAKARGITSGYPDGTFGGGKWVNAAEAAKMTAAAFHLSLPQYIHAPDNWYDPYIDALSSYNIGASLSSPSRAMTRGDMAILIAAFVDGVSDLPYPSLCHGHDTGDTYPSTDGCNTCTCMQNGEACTKKACAPSSAMRTCRSSNECGFGETCTTEYGDCNSACPPGNDMCIQVCSGICVGNTNTSTESNVNIDASVHCTVTSKNGVTEKTCEKCENGRCWNE